MVKVVKKEKEVFKVKVKKVEMGKVVRMSLMPVSHVRLVRHGDEVTIGGIRVSCLFTPCHTTGHICYYVTQVSQDKIESK